MASDHDPNFYGYAGSGKPFDEIPELVGQLPAVQAENARLVRTLRYVQGHRDLLLARIDAALAVCDAGKHQATRWEQPFPVPAWVSDVRAALQGDQ